MAQDQARLQFGRSQPAQLSNDALNSLLPHGSSYVYGIMRYNMTASAAGNPVEEQKVEYECRAEVKSIFFGRFDVVLRKFVSKVAPRKAEPPASLRLYTFGLFEGTEDQRFFRIRQEITQLNG